MWSPTVIGMELATATSVVNVVMDVCRKKALERNELIAATFWIKLAAAVAFLAAFLIRMHDSGGPLLRDSGAVLGMMGAGWPAWVKFLFYLLLDTGLIAAVHFFYLGALKESDISLCVPFMSFTPVLLIPSGYFLLHELPKMGQLLGVVLVIAGSVVMNRQAFRNGPLGPFVAIVHQKGSRNILICATILAFTNPIDKIIVLMTDAVTYSFCYGGMVCLIYAVIVLARRGPWTEPLRQSPGWIVLAGLLDAGVLLLQFTSHNYIDVFVTITVKRAGVILSVFAGWLIFREKHIEDRLVAAIAMLGGVVLIYSRMSPAAEVLMAASLLALLVFWVKVVPMRAVPAVAGAAVPLLGNSVAPLTVRAGKPCVTPPAVEKLDALRLGERRVLRCAFLGCGEVTRNYIGVYRDIETARVTACIDIDEARARQTACLLSEYAAHKGAIRVSGNLEDALCDDVDMVMISTPNNLHRLHAVEALKRGKHVLLQKPITATMQDAIEIVEAAKRSRAAAGIYMSYFDQSVVHDLRRMAVQGVFGTITQVHMKLMHPGGILWSNQAINGNPTWRGSIEQAGGGAFIQLAVHFVRIASWILSQPVAQVQGFASNQLCPGLEGEDSAVAILRFDSGVFATLNMSWCASGEELAIHGSHGSVVFQHNRWLHVRSRHNYAGYAFNYTAKDEAVFDCAANELHPASQPFNQHRLFLEAARDGRPPFISLEAGLQDLAVVTAFYEAVRSGSCVDVRRLDPQLRAAV